VTPESNSILSILCKSSLPFRSSSPPFSALRTCRRTNRRGSLVIFLDSFDVSCPPLSLHIRSHLVHPRTVNLRLVLFPRPFLRPSASIPLFSGRAVLQLAVFGNRWGLIVLCSLSHDHILTESFLNLSIVMGSERAVL